MMQDIFGPVISTYTRLDALADGELIDVTEEAETVGFNLPTAMTRAVFLGLPGMEQDEKCAKEAIAGVMKAMKHASERQLLKSSTLNFEYHGTKLWASCGPGDEGEPMITIMLEGED